MKNNKKEIKNLIVFISYFVYNVFQLVPLSIIGINYSDMTLLSKIIYLLLYEFIYILILILIYNKEYSNCFKEFVKNFKNYILKYMEYWAISFGLMLISNIIIVNILPNSTATNQELINEIFMITPFYIIISSCLFAPIIEETIFRFSLKNIFKSDKLFIFISGITFGALHVIGSFNSFYDLIYIIPYSIPGFVFAYTLVKSKNIFVPMSLHLFHNSLMIFMQIVSTFLI